MFEVCIPEFVVRVSPIRREDARVTREVSEQIDPAWVGPSYGEIVRATVAWRGEPAWVKLRGAGNAQSSLYGRTFVENMVPAPDASGWVLSLKTGGTGFDVHLAEEEYVGGIVEYGRLTAQFDSIVLELEAISPAEEW